MKKHSYILLTAVLIAVSTAFVMAKNDKNDKREQGAQENRYSYTNAAVPVPDAGSTVAMLGVALGGLGLLRKAW